MKVIYICVYTYIISDNSKVKVNIEMFFLFSNIIIGRLLFIEKKLFTPK